MVTAMQIWPFGWVLLMLQDPAGLPDAHLLCLVNSFEVLNTSLTTN
jgi:hypothetical protein